jgi:hypothetical protein
LRNGDGRNERGNLRDRPKPELQPFRSALPLRSDATAAMSSQSPSATATQALTCERSITELCRSPIAGLRFIAIRLNLAWETGAISTRFDEPAHTATAPYASRRAIGLLRRDTECIESGANMRSFQGEEETQKPDWANARDVPNSTLGSNSRGLAAQVIPLFAEAGPKSRPDEGPEQGRSTAPKLRLTENQQQDSALHLNPCRARCRAAQI